MFKIKGIKKEVLKEEDRNGNVIDGITMNTDVKGHWGANGGKEAYADTTKAIYSSTKPIVLRALPLSRSTWQRMVRILTSGGSIPC